MNTIITDCVKYCEESKHIDVTELWWSGTTEGWQHPVDKLFQEGELGMTKKRKQVSVVRTRHISQRDVIS